MKCIKCFGFLFIIVIFLNSCAPNVSEEGEQVNIQISPDKNISQLVSKIYDESQLGKLIRYEGTIYEFDIKYPIECVRREGDIYRVSYLGNESVAIIIFDSFGNKIKGTVYNRKKMLQDFEKLTEGQSLKTVMGIDPKGNYTFLYTGRNDIPKVSSHFTKDGYLITIKYDESSTIVGIDKTLI